MTHRAWLGTSFAIDDFVLPEPAEDNYVRYGIAQREVCPDTEREHVQFYIEFTRPVRMAHVKRIVADPAAHLEQRRGTRDQARQYCSKEETRKPGTQPQEVPLWIADLILFYTD